MPQKKNGPGPKPETIPNDTTTTNSHHRADGSFQSTSIPGHRRPPPQETATVKTPLDSYRNRHQAAMRLPELGCGCRDPWLCRCAAPEPSDKAVEGYASAVELLGSLGYPAAPLLPEMRALWRRGRDERRIMQQVARRWEMVS